MLAQWVRNIVTIWVSLIWGLFIVGSWHKGTEISAYVWGVPGAIYLAMNPTFKITRGNGVESTNREEE